MSAENVGRNTTNILNCYFQNKFTLWHIRLNIYIWKTKFTSNKQYFSGPLFSRNAKKTHTYQSILQAFLLCLKIDVSRTFKVEAAKSSFPSVFSIDTTCFDESFLLYVITANNFFTQKNRYPETWCNRHAAALLQTSALKDVRILCPFSPQ